MTLVVSIASGGSAYNPGCQNSVTYYYYGGYWVFCYFVCVLGTALPIPQDPAEPPPPPPQINNFTVDTLITGGVTPAMLAASGYPNVSRPDLYRPSCNQPIVSQPYPSTTAPNVFPSAAAVPTAMDEVYRQSWYNTAPAEMPQTSPIDYNSQQRFPDNRSPSCVQPTPSFRDAYKQYSYDVCKY